MHGLRLPKFDDRQRQRTVGSRRDVSLLREKQTSEQIFPPGDAQHEVHPHVIPVTPSFGGPMEYFAPSEKGPVRSRDLNFSSATRKEQ